MRSSGSVTIDVRSQIVGYEQSLETLKKKLEHLDSGSIIGKQISEEIKKASKELDVLKKNPMPLAKTEEQIESIVGRVNGLGKSIQSVNELMGKLQLTDIDFSTFKGELGSALRDMNEKATELNKVLSTGLSEAAAEAAGKLKLTAEQFNELLGLDTSTASPVEIMDALSAKATEASDNVKKLKEDLNAANQVLQAKINRKSFLDTTSNKISKIEELQNKYNAASQKPNFLRDTIGANLTNKGVDQDTSKKLLDQFFTDLSPENIKERINSLFNALGSEYKNRKAAFYQEILGVGDGGTININQVVSSLGLDDPAAILNEIQTIWGHRGGGGLIDDLWSSLTAKPQGTAMQIEDLFAANKFEEAFKKLEAIFKRAKERLGTDLGNIDAEITKASNNANKAAASLTSAEGDKDVIDSAKSAYAQQITALQERTKQQEHELAELRQKVETLEAAQLKDFKAPADGGGGKIPQSEIEQYKSELDKVHDKEKLVGKLEGVVQRWFSIYAAVRMVGKALHSVISTIKELDKTITEIAIVTKMSQNDLWKQMDQYTAMARKYATSISGVYEVSQLFYQQGTLNI